MPRGEITQIRSYHLTRVLELRLHHALAAERLDLVHDLASVAPAVEVAAIEGQHFADKAQLALPELHRGVGGQVRGGGAQEPGAVVPDPVAFGELFEEWD